MQKKSFLSLDKVLEGKPILYIPLLRQEGFINPCLNNYVHAQGFLRLLSFDFVHNNIIIMVYNNGLLIKWLATVHTRLNYSLMKSVGLGLSAWNYDPLFTGYGYWSVLFSNDVR